MKPVLRGRHHVISFPMGTIAGLAEIDRHHTAKSVLHWRLRLTHSLTSAILEIARGSLVGSSFPVKSMRSTIGWA